VEGTAVMNGAASTGTLRYTIAETSMKVFEAVGTSFAGVTT
jgi:hypothetical protein